MIVENNQYDKNRTNSKWVAGPNEVFYRSMAREGDVYQTFIKPGRYSAVQQFEVDVCPVRDGWLSALVAEVDATLRTTSVISGPRVISGIICSSNAAGADECIEAAKHPDYIRRHVNGNAIYRMGDKLQELLNATLATYHDWPFDLAAYLTANATNQLNLLRYSEFVHNRVVPIYFKHAYDPALYDQSTYFVHCPLAYKKSQMMDAVYATMLEGLPAVVIGACQGMHPEVLMNLQLSLQRRGIDNVIWTAGSSEPAVSEAIKRMRPLAFAESTDLGRSLASAQCAPPLDVIEHLTNRGRSVFYMDADAVVLRALSKRLAALDQNAVHFASGAVQSHGHRFVNETNPRYRFTSKAFYVPAECATWRGLADVWRNRMMQQPHIESPDSVINAGANCTEIKACQWNAVPIRLLAPGDFVSGNNLLKVWPGSRVATQATVYIDIARGLDGPNNATNATNGRGARFSMQQMRQWLLPRQQTCCSTVIVADDVAVTDDLSTVHAFVNLLLHMHNAASVTGTACVVPPSMDDTRTGLKFSFDVIFDPSYLLSSVNIFSSLADVPVCRATTSIYNASADHILSGIRHWPPAQAFSHDIQRALVQVSRSSTRLADSICLVDIARTSTEGALHLLRGSSTDILSAAKSGKNVYVSGKWRLLDKHVRQVLPSVLTLLSPAFYSPDNSPSSFYSSFGLRSHSPRLGEDPVMDVLDALVCRLTRNTTVTSTPAISLIQIYAEMSQYIEPDVLVEELAATKMFDASNPSPPFLIPLDTLDNNGFSNLVNDAQVLAYVANKVGLRATMMPLSMQHLVNLQRPWSDVVTDVARFYTEMKILRPSTWALMRHPSLLIELLDGYMLAAGTTKYIASAVRLDGPWLETALKLNSKHVFRRLFVASNESDWESKLLQGYDIVLGGKPAYLGLTDDQIMATIGSARETGRDIVFRPFRAFNFQNSNPRHATFEKAWRKVFQIPPALQLRVKHIVDSLAPNFTCYHARVADEFLAQHTLDRPHFLKDNVFGMLGGFIKSDEAVRSNASLPSIYVTTDINERVENIVGRAASAATSCHAFGCPQVKDDVTWGLIESEVCAAAHKFLGNIYSTFTLSICARRNDQSCRDMFDQTLSDGRLLF
jgi:hypothetical protein